MSKTFRRYELLIPLRFNDGTDVPESAIAQTLLQLREQFGAVSSETQIIRGHWEYQGQIFRDDHFRLFVDVADTEENRQFFIRFKDVLKQRFQQIDIWLTSHPVEVL
jgi:hypothetical protein